MHTLTRQGDIGGSIGFISPDHIREFSDVREPADIYCAAATLFYLLTNKYPYLGFDPREPGSYEIILQHPPVPLRAFRPDAPEGLERVLLKALQKQPRDRWKSAQAMADALRPFAYAVVVVTMHDLRRHDSATRMASAELGHCGQDDMIVRALSASPVLLPLVRWSWVERVVPWSIWEPWRLSASA